MPQVVAVAELRQPPPAQQPAEHPFLRFDGPAAEPVDRPFALRKPRSENYTAERHFATQLKIKNEKLRIENLPATALAIFNS